MLEKGAGSDHDYLERRLETSFWKQAPKSVGFKNTRHSLSAQGPTHTSPDTALEKSRAPTPKLAGPAVSVSPGPGEVTEAQRE